MLSTIRPLLVMDMGPGDQGFHGYSGATAWFVGVAVDPAFLVCPQAVDGPPSSCHPSLWENCAHSVHEKRNQDRPLKVEFC